MGRSGRDNFCGSSGEELLNALLLPTDANRIHFTGQSLGGALAEYALYDYARLSERLRSHESHANDLQRTRWYCGVRAVRRTRGWLTSLRRRHRPLLHHQRPRKPLRRRASERGGQRVPARLRADRYSRNRTDTSPRRRHGDRAGPVQCAPDRIRLLQRLQSRVWGRGLLLAFYLRAGEEQACCASAHRGARTRGLLYRVADESGRRARHEDGGLGTRDRRNDLRPGVRQSR